MYRRGFKTWCETTSVALRKELQLSPIDALPPGRLAEHLDIVVWQLEEIPGIASECVATLRADADSWSAATVCVGLHHAIVLNSAHSPRRMNSDLMHELSHLVLAHTPARVDVSPDGILLLSTYDRAQEDEANWLSGALLLPRDVLFHIRKRQFGDDDACTRYGCSQEMLSYRFGVSGVDIQISRARGVPARRGRAK